MKGLVKKPGWDNILLVIAMSIFALLVIAPLVWVFSSSLRPFNEAISFPPKWLPPKIGDWDWSYYKRLFEINPSFVVFLKNSFLISIVCTIGMVFHGTLAGYAYARLKFKGKKIMFYLILVSIMVPMQVTIIPIYKVMSSFNLIDTHLAVTLPALLGATSPGLAGAFGVFLMRQFFMTIPKDLDEAAIIDGASTIRVFFSVMLPQAKAIIASLSIIVFTFAWNDYFNAFIMINSTEKMPLPVGILAIRQPFSTGDQIEFAAVVLSILPVLLVFIFFQKWIVKSMIQTGIKG